MRVAVVGGGISGLAAAWRIASTLPSAEVTVLEGTAEVGGKLALGSVAGQQVDVGAEAVLIARPEGVGLIAEAGLEHDRIDPLTTEAAIFAGGFRHRLPAKTMMGIPGSLEAARESGLFTAAALEAIEREPSRPPLPPLTEDVAVGTVVRDRLGDEVADRLVEPLLGGVYAGRADDLSLVATMPALAAALRDGGSLVEAASSIVDRGRTPDGPIFTSLVGGVGRLPQTLAKAGRFAVRTGVVVRSIDRTPTGFVLTCGPVPEQSYVDADAVVIAVPAAKAARLLAGIAPAAAADLDGVETASMAIVTFAFRDVDLPPGSGLLVAAGERLAVKGVTLSTQKWPMKTDGLTILRASLGRAGENVILQRDDDELISLASRELGPVLGITAQPIDAIVTRWGGGLPQYAVGHVERIARVRAAVATVPGLAVCGAAYDGVGIPACIASAHAAADPIVAGLARQGQ